VTRPALKLFPFRFKGIKVYLRPAPSLTSTAKSCHRFSDRGCSGGSR